MLKSNKSYTGGWRNGHEPLLADEFLKLTKRCHKCQAGYYDNIYVVTPHNECAVDLFIRIAEVGDVRLNWQSTYHQSICHNNRSNLTCLNNGFCRSFDAVEISLSIVCMDYKSRMYVDP
jgi:hypothetical protein